MAGKDTSTFQAMKTYRAASREFVSLVAKRESLQNDLTNLNTPIAHAEAAFNKAKLNMLQLIEAGGN